MTYNPTTKMTEITISEEEAIIDAVSAVNVDTEGWFPTTEEMERRLEPDMATADGIIFLYWLIYNDVNECVASDEENEYLKYLMEEYIQIVPDKLNADGESHLKEGTTV